MRKVSGIVALCLSAGLALAQTGEISSVNVAGYYKVPLAPSNGLSMVAVSVQAFDPTNQNVEAMIGDQLISGAMPWQADRLYMFDTAAQVFRTFARSSVDGRIHSVAQWNGSPTNLALPVGTAFWLQSPTNSVTNRTITVMGEVIGVLTQQTGIVRGLQLAGYPFSCDANMRTWGLTNGTAARNPGRADQIMKWNGRSYEIFFLNTNRQWSVAFPPNATFDLQLGWGFWYLARSNFVWTETNVYIHNL